MPGDPKECRQHALNCIELAKTAPSVQARETFANLANTWLRLAADLDASQALLDAWGSREAEEPEIAAPPQPPTALNGMVAAE
jgi:hypothetical protein